MELRPALRGKIEYLIDKGVSFPNPLTIDIGDEVAAERIAGRGVAIYPGCRIYGAQTVIAAGAIIGQEGPATIENCQIGPGVELKGGYFKQSVFLERANLGLGAQVREACILEEEAGGAHCVGLKQTILFPFVTLGSLINFCDCLMAGGTSRKHHSEVGSSYIHFNFTPEGDKTTASLLGDVPRGVMLNQPPIFLGGQGGMVGPVRLGFGNVVAAGSVLRRDCLQDGRLITTKPLAEQTATLTPRAYPQLSRIVRNNFVYLANLAALGQWYSQVRQPFFQGQEFGDLLYRGALEKLAMARQERCKRIVEMAGKLADTPDGGAEEPLRRELREHAGRLHACLDDGQWQSGGQEQRDRFLAGMQQYHEQGTGYVETIQRLPPEVLRDGTQWLDQVVAGVTGLLASLVPSLGPASL